MKKDTKWITESLKSSGVCLTSSIATPIADYEFIYPVKADPKEIVADTIKRAGIKPSSEEQNQMTRIVEMSKIRPNKIKVGINLREGIYFEIGLSPNKIVERISEK